MTHSNTYGLYDPDFEHDSCGVGIIANINNISNHNTVNLALTMLERMEHRGAHGSEKNTGDGAGIMISIPHKLFTQDIKLPKPGDYAVAMVFLPKNNEQKEVCLNAINEAFKLFDVELIATRHVAVNSNILGSTARSGEPDILQLFVIPKGSIDNFRENIHLLYHYLNNKIVLDYSRSYAEIKAKFYIASFSTKTIVYKGQLTTNQLRQYFIDLQNPMLESRYGVVHSRFSTNTFPSFKLAQPFSIIAHNGEINTLRGNINWMNSRERMLINNQDLKKLEYIFPICNKHMSDSANLDAAIRTLLNLNYSLAQAMTTLIPEAWRSNKNLKSAHKAFYHYSETLFEQWDGPAGVCFSDGLIIGAKADRNGLRPLRYKITNELFIIGSEVGLVDIDEKTVKENGRIAPGNILVLDLTQNKIMSHKTVLNQLAKAHKYDDWTKQHIIKLDNRSTTPCTLKKEQILQSQISNGYTKEDVDLIIHEMAHTGKEPVGSMGIDSPIAILSHLPQLLPSYFQQRFAQVTNPPIDPIRERDVMSLTTFIGCPDYLQVARANLSEKPILELVSPILNLKSFNALKNTEGFKSVQIEICFIPNKNLGHSLEVALNDICKTAVNAVLDGTQILILSDRTVNENIVAIPSLLAVAAIHQRLVREGLRIGVGLIIEAGDVFEAHHLATLIGYGATAVYPYLALATITTLNTNLDLDVLHANFIEALNSGLLKILSKIGVATVWSYYGAQLFEALGIDSHVIDKYFIGTPSKIGGLTLEGIAQEAITKHNHAFKNKLPTVLDNIGIYSWRKNQEYHAYNPTSIHLLQQATAKQNFELFKKYSDIVNHSLEQQTTIRHLLKFTNHEPISITEVESIENILKRFSTGAMSFGSISYEAHTTIAIAMNKIGGKSNSGEGGEDEIRYLPDANGNNLSSAIKQVASGRFGVTISYLANAREIQIKIAQGAKPGEGGQLPGAKVDEWIAKVRHSTAGVGLISPPPHHDIYSIEDLAQLIFDLKNANPNAMISVKLVSQSGVGTVASGVAKAFADTILISGHDGGTGASPLGSIRHAGTPWEIGLSETHQTLVLNKLRDRVLLQTDGQIKTGRDLAIAVLLGAEGFGVSTAALVASGCILTRKCHLNTCPVGIATQNKELRALFSGRVEDIVTLFTFLARELREIMASLGFRTINEMVGRVDKLTTTASEFWKHNSLNLSKILHTPKVNKTVGRYKNPVYQHKIENVLDYDLIHNMVKSSYSSSYKIKNTDRTVGAMLSHHIVTTIDNYKSLNPGTIQYKFSGSAGQSFGAFLTFGVTFTLEGEANDYVGKSLSGGELIIYPPKESTFEPSISTIIGNVAFYGATNGTAYINGQAGERFCVRNSGAIVIVEGIGDHGCEYMTGGTVIILGTIGNNFASGMSGGIAYIYGNLDYLEQRCNLETIDLDPLNAIDQNILQTHLIKHLELTNSDVAKQVINDWDNQLKNFIKVMPKELKKVLAKKDKL